MKEEFQLRTPGVRHRRLQRLSANERATSMLLGIFASGLGVAYLLGGDARFQGPANKLARSWAPWWFWGALFLAYGIAICLTRVWTASHAVLFLGAFFYIIFAASQITSIYQQPAPLAPDGSGTHIPRASFVMPWVYLWLAGSHVFVSRRRLRMAVREANPFPDEVAE